MKNYINKFLNFLLIFVLFSCNNGYSNLKPENIGIHNEKSINRFVSEFLKEQYKNRNNGNNFELINDAKFITSKYSKNYSVLDRKYLTLISNQELDSLISKKDWEFIKEQINEKKNYSIDEKLFTQKIVSDSLITNSKNNKNWTPLVIIDKPLFNENKNKVIFSYTINSGQLGLFSEIVLFEYKNDKWVKVKPLRNFFRMI